MSNEFIVNGVEETKDIAEKLINVLKDNVVFLIGEIGAGKTTFTKYFVESCGLYDGVCSPTFSIENRYETENGLIIHFDLYRMQEEIELDMIGFYDTLKENATILIEWADKFNIEKYIKNYKIVNFKVNSDNSRTITVK